MDQSEEAQDLRRENLLNLPNGLLALLAAVVAVLVFLVLWTAGQSQPTAPDYPAPFGVASEFPQTTEQDRMLLEMAAEELWDAVPHFTGVAPLTSNGVKVGVWGETPTLPHSYVLCEAVWTPTVPVLESAVLAVLTDGTVQHALPQNALTPALC